MQYSLVSLCTRLFLALEIPDLMVNKLRNICGIDPSRVERLMGTAKMISCQQSWDYYKSTGIMTIFLRLCNEKYNNYI